MKESTLLIARAALFLPSTNNSQAQSLKDLLNKDDISKVINAITGTPETTGMTGTWTCNGPAAEFESDNLPMKVGGAAAATMAENKLNEQLSKVGIREGQMSFTLDADDTFTSTIGEKKLGDTYPYNAPTKQVGLRYLKLLGLHTKVNCTSNFMGLLFNSDKLLELMMFLGNKTNSMALKTVSSLAKNYDGMVSGFGLGKQYFIYETKSSETSSGRA